MEDSEYSNTDFDQMETCLQQIAFMIIINVF